MGEDSWLVIDDDLSHCASDSDAIDSETEAELYSTIHYEQNINSQITSPVKFENIEPNHNSSPAIFWSSQENNICTQKYQRTGDLKENEISSKRNTSLHEFKHDSNSTKKSKTDFASYQNLNSDDSENDSQQLFNHKSGENVKNKNLCSTRIKKTPPKKDNTVVLDSSDSDDSNIWKEVDSSEKSDFTINLSKGHIDPFYLTSSDSDSESPSTSSHAFRKRESVLRNLSMPNIKIGEKLEGEWYINTEDLYRSKKYSHRYHNKSDSLCSNCNRKGHNFKNCQEPKALKCFICGGSHLGYRCPNRICSTCFQYGHDRMRCQMGPNCFSCELCFMRGHTIQNCPDLWRRYHLTTDSKKIVQGRKVKQVSNIYCWNCGSTGHFGGACQTGLSRNSVNTWPCVISYEDPREMFRNKRQFQKKNLANWRNGHNFSSNEGSVQAEKKMQKNKKKSAKRRQKQKEKVLSEKERNKKAQRCEKTIRRTAKKIETIVREKNFPRSPKQILQQQCDETPRSLEILRKRSLRKQRLKLNRLLKRQQKLIDGTLTEL